MVISGLTKALKDIMRKDEGINGDAQYIGQIAWLLFLKAFDYKEQEWELLEDNYKPVMPTMYQWRNWAANDEGVTGDELLKFIEHLFDDIKSLETYQDNTRRKWLLKTTINDVINYMKSGTLLRQVINKLNKELDFTAMPDFHLFNDIYETMLKDLQSAGKSGEFYTPRPVTKFIVEMIDPKINEKVLDPACGTGGFLTSVIDRYTLNTQEDYKLLQSNIKGIEKKPYPHILCVTNLMLHNIDVPNIINDNTLRTPVADYDNNDLVDIIVTNPPFGGAEEYAVTSSVPSNLRSKETADLFMVHIMYLLKENGRCGIVLPDGFLFGGNVKTSIKKKLLEECNLHTVIRLPNDVFAPYTNINTNLLFFEKGKKTENIWYYRLEMPEGYKHFSKTRPMQDTHFDPVRTWWHNKCESDVSKLISIDEVIANNYNLDFCGFPHKEEETLVNMRKIKKEKPLPPITDDEIPYNIPENWKWVRLENISYLIGNKNNIILTKQVKETGTYPVVSQSKNLIDGFYDDKTKLIKIDIPVVIFGDHTKNVKYINFDFIIGADGTQILKPIIIDSKFLYYIILYQTFIMKDRGYARHFSLLKKAIFPLPPLKEQERIVTKVDELMALCDKLEQEEEKLLSLDKHFADTLPKSILQYAVEGKLVQQNIHDEPASILYDKIKKENLINMSKIKKEKPIPPITNDEIPYDIPENWKWVRLGEVCEIYTGNSINAEIKNKKYTNLKQGYNYIATKDVNFNTIIDYDNGVKIPFNEINFKIAQKNTTLICVEGGSAGKKIGFLNQDVCFGNKLCNIKGYLLYNQYLFYFAQSPIFLSLFNACKAGIIGGVSVNLIKNILLPLPPLKEQERIVKKVDELLTYCNKLKDII